LVLCYPGPRQLLVPDLVVECGAEYERKRSALAAHRSQFEPARGAATHLASGYFLMAVEGRDRAAGNTVGAEFGEGLTAAGPVSADEVAWMLGGVR
jgi:LmbE family N-acetylglucosaminyl deacetylase